MSDFPYLAWHDRRDGKSAWAEFENFLFFEVHLREDGFWSWAVEYRGSCGPLHGYLAGEKMVQSRAQAEHQAEEWAKEFLLGREASKLAALLDFVNFARSSGREWR